MTILSDTITILPLLYLHFTLPCTTIPFLNITLPNFTSTLNQYLAEQDSALLHHYYTKPHSTLTARHCTIPTLDPTPPIHCKTSQYCWHIIFTIPNTFARLLKPCHTSHLTTFQLHYHTLPLRHISQQRRYSTAQHISLTSHYVTPIVHNHIAPPLYHNPAAPYQNKAKLYPCLTIQIDTLLLQYFTTILFLLTIPVKTYPCCYIAKRHFTETRLHFTNTQRHHTMPLQYP